MNHTLTLEDHAYVLHDVFRGEASPLNAMHNLTICTTRNSRFSKTLYADGTETAYRNAYLVDLDVVSVDNIEDLHELLCDLEGEHQRCIIRGEPINGKRSVNQVRRLYLDNVGTPTIKDVAQNWVMIDFDKKLNLPKGIQEHEISEFIMLSEMPEYFHNTDYVFQFSSKAGIKHWTKGHFWFLLDDFVENKDLKRWHQQNTWADGSMFQPVQPHYTAIAEFVGFSDPVLNRTTLHRKTERTLHLPIPEEEEVEIARLAGRSSSMIRGKYSGAAKWRNHFEGVTADGAHPHHYSAASSYYGIFGNNADWEYFAEYQLDVYQRCGHARANMSAVQAEIRDTRKSLNGSSHNLPMEKDGYWVLDKLRRI